MSKRYSVLVTMAALLGTLSAGCGGRGGAVSGPGGEQEMATLGGSSGVVLSVVSGETGRPVPGAEVRVAGQVHVTDDEGRVAVATAAGSTLDAAATGFLVRETSVPADGRLTLWPDREGFEASFTRELVYWNEQMFRPDGPVTLVPSSDLSDPEALAALTEAAAFASVASAGQVPVLVAAQAPLSGIVVQVSVNPADPFFAENPAAEAVAQIVLLGGIVRGGTIKFKDLSSARLRSLAAHEIGHVLGLGHSAREGMMSSIVSRDRAEFTDAERLALHLTLQRQPPARFPDNDRSISGLSRPRQAIVACLAGV